MSAEEASIIGRLVDRLSRYLKSLPLSLEKLMYTYYNGHTFEERHLSLASRILESASKFFAVFSKVELLIYHLYGKVSRSLTAAQIELENALSFVSLSAIMAFSIATAALGVTIWILYPH